MILAPQVQFQLFGRPSRLGSRRTLTQSGSVADVGASVPFSALTYPLGVLGKARIGGDLFQYQASRVQFPLLPHLLTPVVDDQSTTGDCSSADNFWPETDNADRG